MISLELVFVYKKIVWMTKKNFKKFPNFTHGIRELKMRCFCQHGRRPEVNHAVVDDDSCS